MEKPKIPSPENEKGTAEFILELNAAYEDCRDTLREINSWFDSARSRLEGKKGSD